MKLGNLIFDDEVIEFESFNTFEKNFFYWFKIYLQNVFTNQSKRLIIDKKLNNELIKRFHKITNVNEMREIINSLSNNGFKGPKAYFNPNVKFYEFLKNNDAQTLKDINTSTIKYFLSNELDDYSFQSKKNIFVAIKNFVTFIEEKNYIKNEESHNFKLSKSIIKVINKESKEIAYLTPDDEYYKFLDAIDTYPKWHKHLRTRNKLMLKILLLTGIRANELVRIKVKDIQINKEDIQIEIIGKGNKKRKVFISDDISLRYLKQILKVRESSDDYLFVSKANNRVHERYLNDYVKNIMEFANIPKKSKNGPHLLRHSCCTWLYIVGGFDIAKLQAYMGHEDITTTKKYTHINSEVVKEISKKARDIRSNFNTKN